MSKITKLLVAASALGAAICVAVPAEAATGPSLGPNSASISLPSFSLYKDANFGACYVDDLQSGSLANQVYGVLSCNTSANNTASSMRNFYAQDIYLWDASNCTGALYVANPKSEDSTFSNNDFNDRVSCISY